MVALEARQRSLLIPSLLALPPSPFAERRKRKQADEIISLPRARPLRRQPRQRALHRHAAHRRARRRCSRSTRGSILLDEPTAGVAQKETETFGPLIKTIQRDLGSSILIVEHDMPMVMSISDRIYCLEAGAVIAEGTPDRSARQPRGDRLVPRHRRARHPALGNGRRGGGGGTDLRSRGARVTVHDHTGPARRDTSKTGRRRGVGPPSGCRVVSSPRPE